MNQKVPEENSRYKLVSIIIGLAAILAGIGLVAIGAAIEENYPMGGIIVTNIGASIFTAAIIGIIFESLQKEVFAKDLNRRLGISAQLEATGIQSIIDPAPEVMAKMLTGEGVKLIPIDPVEWYYQHKVNIIKAACEKAINIQIWVPDSDQPAIAEVLGRRQNQTAREVQEDYQRLFRSLESDWNSAQTNSGSSLIVRTYPDLPTVGIFFNGVRAVLEYRYAPQQSPSMVRSSWIEIESGGKMFEWAEGEVVKMSINVDIQVRILKPAKSFP